MEDILGLFASLENDSKHHLFRRDASVRHSNTPNIDGEEFILHFSRSFMKKAVPL